MEHARERRQDGEGLNDICEVVDGMSSHFNGAFKSGYYFMVRMVHVDELHRARQTGLTTPLLVSLSWVAAQGDFRGVSSGAASTAC